VAPKTNFKKKTRVSKRLDGVSKCNTTMLSSMVNMIGKNLCDHLTRREERDFDVA
jgi:hypothetical protein